MIIQSKAGEEEEEEEEEEEDNIFIKKISFCDLNIA